MRVQPIKFTADLQAKTGEGMVVGVAFSGFTSVVVYDGTDATGTPVLVCPSAGTYAVNYEIRCQNGVFVDTTGAGSGSIHLA